METLKDYFLSPGYIFVSVQPHRIHTVVGSCVAVCLWDQARAFGGMSHYYYDCSLDGKRNAKYGEYAIPYMIRLMLRYGAEKRHLRAHIIGGAEHPQIRSPIGKQNVTMAETVLTQQRIGVVTEDVGGQNGRKVLFDNHTGEIRISETAAQPAPLAPLQA